MYLSLRVNISIVSTVEGWKYTDESCCVWTGGDADVLSIGEAIEPLFVATPPPAEEQQCSGCTPSVKVVNVTWDGAGTPLETDTTSAYTLELAGDCALKSAVSIA